MCELLLVIQELFRVRMILPIQLNLVYATRSFSGASMRQALHGDPLAVTELYGAYIKRNAGGSSPRSTRLWPDGSQSLSVPIA